MIPLLFVVAGLFGAGWPAPGGPESPRRHVVEIRGMAFEPAALEVAPGDTVVWINRDMVPHTATSAGRDGWDTGILARGDSGSRVFHRAGTTAYVCALHPTMRGAVTVTGRAP